jgi:hypothetical protein
MDGESIIATSFKNIQMVTGNHVTGTGIEREINSRGFSRVFFRNKEHI